jgi:hypothetical protein
MTIDVTQYHRIIEMTEFDSFSAMATLSTAINSQYTYRNETQVNNSYNDENTRIQRDE